MNREFDPGGVGVFNGQFFGFPYRAKESGLVYVPVPWDATTSYHSGAAEGPAAMIQASVQLDFADADVPNAWTLPRYTDEATEALTVKNKKARKNARYVMDFLEDGGNKNAPEIAGFIEKVNRHSQWMVDQVESVTGAWLDQGKYVALVGGDHSCPLGYLKALAKREPGFGILQIDAHADLRECYQGFHHSHASIMHNAMQISGITHLTQVGIRDLSPQEQAIILKDDRVTCFNDFEMNYAAFEGKLWSRQCQEILQSLPDKVYISIDIDGLSPYLCPNTGTPVPGGMTFYQLTYLLRNIYRAGKKVVGFDLVEVSPESQREWDANVGARTLYKLSNLHLHYSAKSPV